MLVGVCTRSGVANGEEPAGGELLCVLMDTTVGRSVVVGLTLLLLGLPCKIHVKQNVGYIV